MKDPKYSYLYTSNYRNCPPVDLNTRGSFCGCLHGSACEVLQQLRHGIKVLGQFWFGLSMRSLHVLMMPVWVSSDCSQRGKSWWNSTPVFYTQINVSSASFFHPPLQGAFKALAFGNWKVGEPPKRPTDVEENHRAPQDCWRACLILKTDGWRAETPAAASAEAAAAAAAAVDACSSSDFRGKRRNREILWSAHAPYARSHSGRLRSLCSETTGISWVPDETIWLKDECSGALVNDKDAVSVSCLLCSDVWKIDLKS